jgi:hypothetical protein
LKNNVSFLVNGGGLKRFFGGVFEPLLAQLVVNIHQSWYGLVGLTNFDSIV